MIFYGDALDFLANLGDGSVNLIVTDPPYDLIQTKAGGTRGLGARLNASQADLTAHKLDKCQGIEWCKHVKRIQGGKINCYVWCNKAQIPQYFDYFIGQLKCSFDIIIWHKPNTPPTFYNKWMSDKEYCLYFRKGAWCMPENYQDASTVFTHPTNQRDKKLYGHPTVKPLEIIERLIRNSSKPGDLVIDPFVGSGTTGHAAINLDRRFKGSELDRQFAAVAQARICQAVIDKTVNKV